MEEITVQSYADAEAFLSEVPKFTKKNPLEETRGFYAYIQGCEDGKYAEEKLGKLIHIAGTNGKGSVCAFLQGICRESGYRTGMFISPHLVTTRERFWVDGSIISEEAFVCAFNWLAGMVEAYRRIKPDYCPTYFERLFFMGVYVFARAGVDITILETGLGGRLDTTNVISNPILTVITEIGFDHMEYLGGTIEQIASEKAGIIKHGVPVVFVDRKKQVSRIIGEKAAAYGCKCCLVSKNDYKINEIQKKFIDFSVSSLYYDYGRIMVRTTAVYQVENAAVAIRACEVLKRECGFEKITVKSIQAGISGMFWAGRMEEIVSRVCIDGAHNEDGIAAFVQSLKEAPDLTEVSGSDRNVLIFSVVKDKQYDKMIEMLCGLQMITDFVVTHIPGERGADLKELERIFGRYADKSVQDIHVCENIEDAVKYSMSVRGKTGMVYIVGSLYLAGFVRKFLG
ncbi:MAG: bifunctional folylpolyglutamate synthase/dihydrofolate synthase [Lachnospiraceae bacterium]|nr:bifunctional folylpolyglutamate synthase/dihydrofolate synthase [Lachnospiraceae bacterium]